MSDLTDTRRHTRDHKTKMSTHRGMDYTKSWRHSDIVLKVQGKRLHVNKIVLSMWSPVFEVMFNSDFKEKNSKEINLPGKVYEEMLSLVQVVHPPNRPIDDKCVYQLLPLAREYQMTAVLEKCEEFLVTQPPNFDHLIIAEEYNLPRLLDICIDHASHKPLQDLDTKCEYQRLEQSTLIELLRRKIQNLENQQTALTSIRELANGDRAHWRYECLDESKHHHKQRSDISCDACCYWICDEIRKRCKQLEIQLDL